MTTGMMDPGGLCTEGLQFRIRDEILARLDNGWPYVTTRFLTEHMRSLRKKGIATHAQVLRPGRFILPWRNPRLREEFGTGVRVRTLLEEAARVGDRSYEFIGEQAIHGSRLVRKHLAYLHDKDAAIHYLLGRAEKPHGALLWRVEDVFSH